MVATPIGNLADISLRALHVLQLVDALACEDTRHTQTLLHAYGLGRSNQALLPVHQHNETEAAQHIISRLQAGERVAYVSDAGTPAVSDPGARLVAAVRAAGLPVMPLPGASSVTTALSVAGVVDPQESGFVFVGFLPPKAGERQSAVQLLVAERRAVVVLEAGGRYEPGDFINDEWESFAQLAWKDMRTTSGSWRVARDFPNLPAWVVKAVGGSTVDRRQFIGGLDLSDSCTALEELLGEDGEWKQRTMNVGSSCNEDDDLDVLMQL